MQILVVLASRWTGVRLQVLEKGKCRKKKANIHDPNGSKYCYNCKHRSLTDDHNNCDCCRLHIPNQRQFTELRTFEKILRQNYSSVVEWMALPSSPDYNFGWPVRIGIINYFVPVRYFAEYLELPELEGEDIPKKFLENVKRESAVLGRYMHAIK